MFGYLYLRARKYFASKRFIPLDLTGLGFAKLDTTDRMRRILVRSNMEVVVVVVLYTTYLTA